MVTPLHHGIHCHSVTAMSRLSRCRHRRWERSAYRSAASENAFSSYLSTVRLDEVFHDGEAEAGASALSRARRISSVKSLEDAWKVRGRDSHSGIAHTHPCVSAIVALCKDGNGSLR